MSLSGSIYTGLGALTYAAACILLVVSNIFSLGFGAELAVYALLGLTLLMLCIISLKGGEYAPAFEFKNSFRLDVFAHLSAASFIILCALYVFEIYQFVSGGRFTAFRISVLALLAVLSLFSALCMASVGMSFGESRYDFRRLKWLSFAPMLWSIVQMCELLFNSFQVTLYASDALKVLCVVCVMCFYYRFSFETLSDSGASSHTLFFSGALPFSAVLFFIERLMLVLGGKAELFCEDSIFALALLLMSPFAFFIRRNILSYSKDSGYAK